MISTVEIQPAGAEADLVSTVERMFSPEGLLARASNFEYRVQQQQMAVAIAEALLRGEHLAVEAGTGVGKSLAYLIPAIYHAVRQRKRAVISTHTINLQEQLMGKDLPMLANILPVKFKYAMLKGRQNYLCSRRLVYAMKQADGLFTSPEIEELKRIYEWSKTTEDGSLSDFTVEPDPKVWQQVCSERGLCSPKQCGPQSDFAKEHGACFFQRARSRLLSADVLVLNHTLFFTLLGHTEESVKDGILLRNDFVVFDEAHTLESVASRLVGLGVSHGQIRYALRRLWNPRTEKGLLSQLRQGNAVKWVAELLEKSDEFFTAIEAACDHLDEASAKTIETSTRRGRSRREWTEMRIRRSDLVPDTLTLPLVRMREAVGDLIKATEDKETGEELMECNRRLIELREEIAAFLSQSLEEHVYWVERAGKGKTQIELHAAPVQIAEFLRQRLFSRPTSVILTSATLATSLPAPSRRLRRNSSNPADAGEAPSQSRAGGSENSIGLAYFTQRVGADSARALQLGSPFDYQRQMKLYVVDKMPDPRSAEYAEALEHWIKHFVRLTHGKAFVLFTNFKLMQEMGDRLKGFFEDLGLDCLVQGTGIPRTLMLEKFKTDVDSVLFGTDSFWQGVDVPGEALSNVIITRLPFAVPDHPLIEARLESIEARGGNAFREFSLPEAILKFRQGVGRLIRTRNDQGIVVVLDNRVLNKQYGQAFLNSLPECPLEIV